jgi:hypothetical protein
MSLAKRRILAGLLSVVASILAGSGLAVLGMHAAEKELPDRLTAAQMAELHADEVADAKRLSLTLVVIVVPLLLLYVRSRSRRRDPGPRDGGAAGAR